MRVGSIKNRDGEVRGCMQLGARLVDLSAAFELYLLDRAGVSRSHVADAASVEMPGSMLAFLRREEAGQENLSLLYSYLWERGDGDLPSFSPAGHRISYSPDEVRLLTPVPQVYRILNVGVNYEILRKAENIIGPGEGYANSFRKPPRAIIGPEDHIVWPAGANEVVSELELALIIGRTGKAIPEDEALDYVFGYVVGHDIAVLDLLKNADWGKSGNDGFPGMHYAELCKYPDTFEPVGPFIVTKDEVPDCQNVSGEFRVNGEPRIRGNTRDMRLPVRWLIHYLSEHRTFYPGDLLVTGGMGSEDYPPLAFLQPGDVVEAELKGLGVLRNYVVPAA